MKALLPCLFRVACGLLLLGCGSQAAAPAVTVNESNYTEASKHEKAEPTTPHSHDSAPVELPPFPDYEEKWWEAEEPCPPGSSLVGGAPPEHESVGCRTEKGVNQGTYTGFYPDGKKQEQGQYKDHVATGVWVDWSEQGKVLKAAVYKAGKRDGYETEYFPDGKVKSQREYRNGERDGLTTLWDEKGVKRSALEYAVGKQHGITTYWDETGRVVRVEHWKTGQKQAE